MSEINEVVQQAVTDWGTRKPQTYVYKEKRKKRDGPEWGTGAYKGQRVINSHTGKYMYMLRSTDTQRADYTRLGKIEHVYSDAVDHIARIQRERLQADQQVTIVIQDAYGNGTGGGKSLDGLVIATAIQRAMKRSFILSRDLIFDQGSFIGRVRFGGANSIMVMDEAHQIVGKNKASERGTKMIRESLYTLRSQNNLLIMVTPKLSGLSTFVEEEILDIRIDCSNPQRSWVSGIGRGLFQCYIAERQQTFGLRASKKYSAPFWRLLFTGICTMDMLPYGLWQEYLKFKKKFQEMMLDRSIKKLELNDEGALSYIKQVYNLDVITPVVYEKVLEKKPPKPPGLKKRGRPFGSKDSYKRKRKISVKENKEGEQA